MPIEYVQRLRQKYPEYADLSDRELAQRVVTKYPEYQDVLGDIASGAVGGRAPEPPSLIRQAVSEAARPFGQIATGLATLPVEAAKGVYGAVTAPIETVKRTAREMPQALTETLRMSPVVGGAIAGATASLPFAPAAGPFAPVVPAIGAGLGAAGGAGWQQVFEHLFGSEQAPQTSEEAAQRIRNELLLGMAGEGTGAAITRGVQKVAAPYAHRMTQAGGDFLQFLKDAAAKTGEAVTPAIQDIRNAPAIARLSATVRKMIGGGPIEEAARSEIRAVRGEPATKKPGFAELRAEELVGPRPGSQVGVGVDIKAALENVQARTGQARGIRRQRIMDQAGLTSGVPTATRGEALIGEAKTLHQRNVAAVTQAEDAFLASTGTARDATAIRGRETYTALRNLADQLSDEGGYMYDQAAHLDPGIPTVEIKGAAKKARGLVEQIEQLDTALKSDKTVPPPTDLEQIRKLLESIANLDGQRIPFGASEALGQKLRALQDKYAPLEAVRGALKADQAALKVTNPAHQPLVEAYEEARRAWREGPVQFMPDKPLGALIKESKEPVAVMDKLLAGKDASIGLLEAVKKQVSETGDILTNLRSELLQRMVENPKYAATVGPQTKAALLHPGEEVTIANLHKAAEQAAGTQAARLSQTAEGTRALESLLQPKDRSIQALEEVRRTSGREPLTGTSPAWRDLTSEAVERSLTDKAYYDALGPRTKNVVFDPKQRAAIERMHSLPPPIAENVRRYLTMDAGNIVKDVLGAGERNLESIAALKTIIGKTPAWKSLESEALHSLANDPAAINRLSKAKLSVLFDSQDQQALLRSVSGWYERSTAAMRLQRGEFERPTGTLIAPAMQIGGAASLGLSILEGTGATSYTADSPWLRRAVYAGTVLLAPSVFARLATRPGAVKWMTVGFHTPAGTPEAARILGQIIPRYNAEAKKMGEPPIQAPQPSSIPSLIREAVGPPKELSQPVAGGTPSPQAPAPAAPMTSLPPAVQHTGRTIRDLETGKRWQSDGTYWREIP